MTRTSLFVFAALIVTGVVIHTHQSERAGFEAQARSLAADTCADDDTPQHCASRLEASHADCFMVTFDSGRAARKFDSAPPSFDGRGYLDCVTQGFAPWRKARNERRREQARLRRGDL